MKKNYFTIVFVSLAALITLSLVFAFTRPAEPRQYEMMVVEYDDYKNTLFVSTTAGPFSLRNVKSLLLDRDYDRTPFLNEIKLQQANGWEVVGYSSASSSSSRLYSCMMRKAIN